MSYSNGLLPSSSSSSSSSSQRGLPGVPGVGFKLTDDGNFDIDNKRLTNVSQPTDGSDATTQAYVDSENSKQDIAIADKASKNDLDTKLDLDGSKQMTGNLNMNNKKITSLAESVDDNDAVSLKVLKQHNKSERPNSSKSWSQ